MLAVAGGTAQAQPTRRDQPLRTPKPGGRAVNPPRLPGMTGPGATPGSPGTGGPAPGAPGSGAPGQPGDPNAPKVDPTAIFKKKPDIQSRPKAAGALIKFNLDEADLPDMVKAISAITGRKFILTGKLRKISASVHAPGKITVHEAYQAFLSILDNNGMTVIPHGRFLKIVDSAGIQSQTTPILGTATPVPHEDRFVTRLYRLKHIDAGEAQTVLSKFKSKEGDVVVYAASNLLIITDTGSNIRRMLRIIEELDAGGAGEQIWMQPIHCATATDVAAKLSELLDSGGGKARILAEDSQNLLIMVTTESDYLKLLEIIKRIDVCASGDGSIHVLPLQHAQCDELSTTLSSILGSGSGATSRPTTTAARGRTNTRTTPARGGASASGGNNEVFQGEVRVTCDEATNSLITTSSLRDYAQLRSVIDRLDQPRRQVFIEAVIMDVSVNNDRTIGLGYHGGGAADLGGGSDTIFLGGFGANNSLTGIPTELQALAFGVRGPELEGTSNLTPTGLSIPGFGVVLTALATSGNANVLATPHILATDNIEATINIGQNIPLQTNVGGGLGNLASLAGAAGGAGGAGGLGALLGGGLGFQAPRQDVGIQLTITPHINDSNQVRMELKEEFSTPGPAQGDLGAVPIDKRSADTTVIVRDQQTVVIGGLMRENQLTSETKVPVLGDIPVLGLLFRRNTRQTQKNNLLLIITPHIVRDQTDLRRIFEQKMQERQEFLDRFFVFDDSLPWEPLIDYSRANGLVEHIRQTQLAIAVRERLAREIAPDAPKTHEPVRPVALPSIAAPPKPTGGGASKPAAKPRPRPKRTPKPARRSKPKFKVPGSALRNPLE